LFGFTGRNGHDHHASRGVLADKPLSSIALKNYFAAQYETSKNIFENSLIQKIDAR
jgi:hypothetical protein